MWRPALWPSQIRLASRVCAYFLALHGYRPILLERGTKVSDRIRDVKRFDAGGEFHPESNYLFGEGGAGTFSDGKLTYLTSVSRSNLEQIADRVQDDFAKSFLFGLLRGATQKIPASEIARITARPRR